MKGCGFHVWPKDALGLCLTLERRQTVVPTLLVVEHVGYHVLVNDAAINSVAMDTYLMTYLLSETDLQCC